MAMVRVALITITMNMEKRCRWLKSTPQAAHRWNDLNRTGSRLFNKEGIVAMVTVDVQKSVMTMMV